MVGDGMEREGWMALQILGCLKYPVLLLDLDFTIQGFNKATSGLLGIGQDEARGKKCYRFFHQTDAPPVNCPLRRFRETGEISDAEMWLPVLGGRWFLVSISPMEDVGGAVNVVHLAKDITDQKELEERLKESERRYREIFDKSAAGVFRSAPDGRLLDINPRLLEILGYDSVEELRQVDSARDLYLNPEERRYFVETLESEGKVERFRVWLRRKDSAPVCVSIYATVVRDDKGNSLYYHGTVIDITERMREAEALRQLQDKWTLFVERAPVGFFQFKPDGEIVSINSYMAKVLGRSQKQLLGSNVFQEICERLEDVEACQERLKTIGEVSGREVRMIRRDGVAVWLRLYIHEVMDDGVCLYEGVCQDVTHEKLFQEQIFLSQKMEAIGRLAGGLAHDFNNILMVVLGSCELMLDVLDETAPLCEKVKTIRDAADRAAVLTRQLLAFSRKQIMEPKVIDLNGIVADMEKMLRRLIGEDVELETVLAPALWRVEVDPAQMEQVIMNLVVNAREAMPKGGVLTIETANVEIDDEYAHTHVGVVLGDYVMLAVSDTGCGMDKETKTKAFEPFFTTKEDGTGLGLAMVYGIVKQFGGNIWCYSEPGEGTTFKIYLPRAKGEMDAEVGHAGQETLQRGTETLLVAEDDDGVREIAVTLLRSAGYEVLGAASGKEALEVFEKHGGPVDALITDVVMPEMSGKELAESLKVRCPGIKVIYMSGYTDNIIAHHGVLEKGVSFIQKPFTRGSLLRKVREVLGS
jgi:PAS domain S-box-containing protein